MNIPGHLIGMDLQAKLTSKTFMRLNDSVLREFYTKAKIVVFNLIVAITKIHIPCTVDT